MALKKNEPTGTQEASSSLGPGRNWHAQLTLELSPDGVRHLTQLQKMQFHGPLRVMRPFYPEGETCHLYLLHPPGGLVSGDWLNIEVTASEEASALITTPSAGKCYQADSWFGEQRQTVTLTCKANSQVEWLPQETIVFDKANASLNNRIELAPRARFIGWDILSLGRPAANAPYRHGVVDQRWQIFRQGRPLLIERLQLGEPRPSLTQGVDKTARSAFHKLQGKQLMSEPWGLGGNTQIASFFAIGWTSSAKLKECQKRLQDKLDELSTNGVFSTTQRLDDVLVVRYLGSNLMEAKAGFLQAWQIVRPMLLGKEVCPPAIWST